MFITNSARAVLKGVSVLTWLALFVSAGLLLCLLAGIGAPTQYFSDTPLPGHEDAYRHLFELTLVVSVALAAAVRILCDRAVAMLDTIKAGTPFVAANARRLYEIGWTLLAVQFLDLGYAWLNVRMAAASGHDTPMDPQMTGWLAILLIFVLARVFAHGTELQDEVEGTV